MAQRLSEQSGINIVVYVLFMHNQLSSLVGIFTICLKYTIKTAVEDEDMAVKKKINKKNCLFRCAKRHCAIWEITTHVVVSAPHIKKVLCIDMHRIEA